jgi:hypothetical protein
MDRQIIIQEDKLQWLIGWGGDMKGENESEIIAAQDQALQSKYHATKILQTETDSNHMMRQLNTSYQHAEDWQKNNTYGDMTDCVLNYILTYAKK